MTSIADYTELSPLKTLLLNKKVNEILVNNENHIVYEIGQELFLHTENFKTIQNLNRAIECLSRICQSCLSREKPFLETQIGEWRLSMVFQEICGESSIISFRRHQKINWRLDDLASNHWCTPAQLATIQKLLAEKKNLLIVGATSSGKTTALQALLNSTAPGERCVILQDTAELMAPNAYSVFLKARPSVNTHIQEVSLQELVTRALRLRPDRLIVGEVRGVEAYSLLMALSTGHRGSISTLHARSAREALLRLEMLIQLGAPQWSLGSIRRLIGLSLDAVLVVEKDLNGRNLKEICRLRSVEETGITLEKMI